ncbi:WbqC family protein [Adhaeribacter rhizoryzae]|uniref:WbqC family protein n=1 Tax=Adhaeribacter rhizoryzae TaxID=2607907 RepID=A0A5M6DSQ4_9BACT|nr:WbqC family protein [Adhaeribacter rhizoryzae]
MLKTAILQSNYIPWKGYFDLINSVDEFILYDEMQYTKNDWRNRNKIKTPNGVQWLTIPVKQDSLEQKINETKVFDPKWNIKHWRTLQQNYSKAPYFKFYKELFENLYLTNSTSYLSQINLLFITAICNELGIKTKITSSEQYSYGDGKTERLVNLVKATGGKEYVSGPAAKDYLNESLFEEAGIKVTWMNYAGYQEYHQLFPPFEHGVSILDLLFNEGPNASLFMKSFVELGKIHE